MQTKHICVLIHILTKGEVGAPWNRFKLSSKMVLLDHLYYFCFVFIVLLCASA